MTVFEQHLHQHIPPKSSRAQTFVMRLDGSTPKDGALEIDIYHTDEDIGAAPSKVEKPLSAQPAECSLVAR